MFLRWLWLVVEFFEVVRRFSFPRTLYTIKLLKARELRTNPHHSKANKFQTNRPISLKLSSERKKLTKPGADHS